MPGFELRAWGLGLKGWGVLGCKVHGARSQDSVLRLSFGQRKTFFLENTGDRNYNRAVLPQVPYSLAWRA